MPPIAWIQGLVARLPARCEVCHAWPARPLCEACVQRFAQPVARCRRCALPLPPGQFDCGACLHQPPPLDACHAALPYAWPWDGLIARFKFRGEPAWASSFAPLMRSMPWIEPALESAELVLPVPLAPRRLAERGYNQALELARRLAPGKLAPQLLRRVRETEPQAALGQGERLRNVRQAFAVDPAAAASLRGRALLLVDDVMTSGATLHAAAQALRQAGAGSVSALVLARTEPSH